MRGNFILFRRPLIRGRKRLNRGFLIRDNLILGKILFFRWSLSLNRNFPFPLILNRGNRRRGHRKRGNLRLTLVDSLILIKKSLILVVNDSHFSLIFVPIVWKTWIIFFAIFFTKSLTFVMFKVKGFPYTMFW